MGTNGRAVVLVGLGAALGVLAFGQDPLEPMVWPADEQEAARIADYFALADFDRSGWISFEEASQSMGVDRDGFARFDSNRDGRIQFEEFEARYREVLDRGGAFERPRAPEKAPLPPARDAAGLLFAYDSDLNGALSIDEIETLLSDYQVKNTSAAFALSQFDNDGSGRLERGELEYLAGLIATLRGTAGTDDPKEAADSLEALFGTPIPRPREPGSVPAPARISGPVRPFYRLDQNGDGAIDAADLESLQFPLTLSVRSATVLASLDRDGDGRLSHEELRLAFEPPGDVETSAPLRSQPSPLPASSSAPK